MRTRTPGGVGGVGVSSAPTRFSRGSRAFTIEAWRGEVIGVSLGLETAPVADERFPSRTDGSRAIGMATSRWSRFAVCGEPMRPREEMDYLERLLRRY